MDSLIYHNDRIVDAAGASVAPTAGGLIYGWGVFTTLRIYDGKAFAFDQHWERLVRHAERARVAVPVDAEQARSALGELVTANATRQGRARITILKGGAGTWQTEQAREAELLIFTSSEVPRAPARLAITLSPYRLLSTSPFAGVKRTAMLEHLLALDEARSRGFSEAVMFNERGEMISATAANLFWVQGDEIFTPSLATGCVAGVTRKIVHDIAARWRLHVVEGGFTVQRLLDAREVFLTSTAREVAIVSSFDAKEYDLKEARISGLISREFKKLVISGMIY
jgi:branched-chain amino acid aminotransferase